MGFQRGRTSVSVHCGFTYPLTRSFATVDISSSQALVQRPLDVMKQSHVPHFYEAVADVMSLRKEYIRDRNIMVTGQRMIPILKALGAREEDFKPIQSVSENLGIDPTLPFRESKNCRFCLDLERRMVTRLEFQPFALSIEEDFKRHDSGQIRRFEEVGNDLQQNTVLQALLLFKIMMLHNVPTIHRDKLNYSTNKWICTLFNIRTITTPEMLGQPALEGVHSDGVDHTMTTFLGSSNMAPNSAVTYLHEAVETTGIRVEETNALNIRARSQHRDFLDTLIIADNEYKHSLSPVFATDASQRATRDMLVFFTRKPVTKGHISEKLDSLLPHESLKMEMPIWIPQT